MRFKLILLGLFTIIFAQNCSKIDVADANNNFSSKNGELTVVEGDDATIPEEVIDIDDLPPAGTPTEPDVDDVVDVDDDLESDQILCSKSVVLKDGEFDFSSATEDRVVENVHGNIDIPLARNLSMAEIHGNIYVRGAQSISMGENIAGNLRFIAASAPYMKSMHGNIRGCIKTVGEIRFIKGNIRMVNPTATAGTIDSISDVEGNIIIRNFNVRSVSNVKGNLIIINGSVGSLNNVQGNVIMQDASSNSHSNLANLVH